MAGKKRVSPKTGGRGTDHRTEPRDKVIRIRSKLYKKLAGMGSVENDIDDIISMVFEFWEKHHKE